MDYGFDWFNWKGKSAESEKSVIKEYMDYGFDWFNWKGKSVESE